MVGSAPDRPHPSGLRVTIGVRLHECGPVAQLGARLNGIQEVTGSIPVRSTTLHKELLFFDQSRDLRLWLRLGCAWMRRTVIEAVHGGAIRARNQVAVRVDGDLDRRRARAAPSRRRSTRPGAAAMRRTCAADRGCGCAAAPPSREADSGAMATLSFPGEWPTKSLGKPGAATARLAGWIDGASANSRMRDGRTEAPWTATRKP